MADDLLKNDGQKLLKMEQLVERCMQLEEEAAADAEDEGEEDEEDEEVEVTFSVSFESLLIFLIVCWPQAMAEKQKMEEGKQMFSIFAARMFEQRVLQAYRERVAQRQIQLLRELEDEDQRTKEREAKKQTQNQKKDKKK